MNNQLLLVSLFLVYVPYLYGKEGAGPRLADPATRYLLIRLPIIDNKKQIEILKLYLKKPFL